MGRRNDHTRKELKEMAIKARTKLIEEIKDYKIAAHVRHPCGSQS